jgi:hypothetical protein
LATLSRWVSMVLARSVSRLSKPDATLRKMKP